MGSNSPCSSLVGWVQECILTFCNWAARKQESNWNKQAHPSLHTCHHAGSWGTMGLPGAAQSCDQDGALHSSAQVPTHPHIPGRFSQRPQTNYSSSLSTLQYTMQALGAKAATTPCQDWIDQFFCTCPQKWHFKVVISFRFLNLS